MHYSPYVLPLIIAALLALTIAMFVWRRLPAPGILFFSFLCMSIAAWSLGYALELASSTLTHMIFWSRIQYLAIVIIPVVWFFFVLQYTGRTRWVTPRGLTFFLILPLMTLLLVWTNQFHHLIWQTTDQIRFGNTHIFHPTYGGWFWVHTLYSYLLLAGGAMLLARSWFHSPRLYRGQTGMLLIGISAPWIGNMLYVSRLSPWAYLDLTPFAFTLSCLCIALALFRFKLLDVVPVARDLVIESLSDGVMVLDADGRIVDMNPTALRGIGRSSVEVIGQPANQILADWPDMLDRYRDATHVTEVIRYGEGDAQCLFDLRISPLYDRRGKLRGRLIVWHDITERTRAEEALRRQNAELTALQDTTLELLNNLDLSSTLEAIVTRAAALVGTEHGYIYVVDPTGQKLVVQIGIGMFVNYTGWSLKRGEGVAGRAWQSGEPQTVDNYADWHERHFDFDWLHAVVAIPLRAHGQIIGVIGVAYVESQRTFGPDEIMLLGRFGQMAALALENARLYAAAQQELIERKRTEIALSQARDSAEAANRMKSAFLANMTHELRTPLTIILGYSQLLRLEARKLNQIDVVSQLNAISAAGEHLLSLINNVLDLSKIEAGKMELYLEEFDLLNLIKEVEGAVYPLVQKQANDLQVEYPDDLGMMYADLTRVRQVLFNLLSNAAKFTDNGRITLVVSRAMADAQEWVHFQVSDTGIGVSPEQIIHLFREFSQVDQSTNRRHNGSGLGLAISRHFCHMMGGDITVASEVGAGSTFSVRLPARVIDPLDVAVEADPIPANGVLVATMAIPELSSQ